MKKIHIAVTGINATDNPGPGTGVIRSIKYDPPFDMKIIGLAYDSMDPGIFQKNLVDCSYLIPYPSQEPKVLLERILYIDQQEKIDVLIPTLDAELLNFIAIEKELKEAGIKMFLPTKEKFSIRSKDKLAKFCEDNGIDTPKTYSIGSMEQLYNLDVNYPVFIKGIFYDAYLAYSFAEAGTYFGKIQAKWGVPVIVQEFAQGEEFDIVALGDGEGETIGAVAMKKMSLTEKKKAWAGVSIDNKELIDITKKLIKGLKWRGAMEAEIIYDQKNDKYYLIEINPRFPAWCYLSAGAGQNLPQALVKLAMGEDIEPLEDYKSGKLFIRYSSELIADISEIEKLFTTGYLKRD